MFLLYIFFSNLGCVGRRLKHSKRNNPKHHQLVKEQVHNFQQIAFPLHPNMLRLCGRNLRRTTERKQLGQWPSRNDATWYRCGAGAAISREGIFTASFKWQQKVSIPESERPQRFDSWDACRHPQGNSTRFWTSRWNCWGGGMGVCHSSFLGFLLCSEHHFSPNIYICHALGQWRGALHYKTESTRD